MNPIFNNLNLKKVIQFITKDSPYNRYPREVIEKYVNRIFN